MLFVKLTNIMTGREIESSRIIINNNVVAVIQIKIKGGDGYAIAQ